MEHSLLRTVVEHSLLHTVVEHISFEAVQEHISLGTTVMSPNTIAGTIVGTIMGTTKILLVGYSTTKPVPHCTPRRS